MLCQGSALTALHRPAAIHEGPSFVRSTLGDVSEGDGQSAGWRDFPESRSGLGNTEPPLLFFCSHFKNIERPRGDSAVSRFASGCDMG